MAKPRSLFSVLAALEKRHQAPIMGLLDFVGGRMVVTLCAGNGPLQKIRLRSTQRYPDACCLARTRTKDGLDGPTDREQATFPVQPRPMVCCHEKLTRDTHANRVSCDPGSLLSLRPINIVSKDSAICRM